jgi:hypothetical protein
MPVIVHREQNPDGTITLWYDDRTSLTVGTPVDPVQRATQAGASAAAQTRAQYSDPWYQENVLGPMNRSAEQAAQDRAAQFRLQGDQLKLQGRIAEANEKYQQAQIELRKAELQQSGYFQNRSQQLQAAGMIANARGAGNAAQRVDLGRRLEGFGTQSTALADIAAGRVPQGAFAMAEGSKPLSEADRMSGLLGASASQIETRDRNDRMLARQIGGNATRLARGSVDALSPYEQSYMGSYLEAEGYDQDQFMDEYRRAGIMQGSRRG